MPLVPHQWQLQLPAHPWGCGEQLGPSGAGPGPRPSSQDPAPHQEAACGAGHSPEPLKAAPAVSLCGLSHAGLRATRAADDAGRAFLGPVPRSRMGALCRGGALMPCPGVLWVHPPAGAGGQENHRAQGEDAPPPTWARGPRLLPHTHLLCVSDCHTAGASHSGCSLDHPPAPRHAYSPSCAQGLLPAHSARRLLGPGTSAGVSSPLRLRPLPPPAASFIQQNAH